MNANERNKKAPIKYLIGAFSILVDTNLIISNYRVLDDQMTLWSFKDFALWLLVFSHVVHRQQALSHSLKNQDP